MNQRTAVHMPAGEVAALLAAGRKLQVATINPDGTPHLVTMFYGLRGGRIAFWTYRDSQKARNLARDPRLTCLVEDGEDYFELRGVQVSGVVRQIDDLAGVTEIGKLVASRMPGGPGGPPGETAVIEEYVERAAGKRVAYLVEPRRTVSWDHRRLLT
ncbi:pyridoxamine 5'-phosphate oxidase family protein [Couchioplanes caeruleus]|uniref:Pyridoxamine 5'-phosphate oxidase n=2 Tax=Couchioplanes caeruleus TaxID=56438 RepID=A0A1K0FQU2_9ACTN|nr:pyridoxamine 5'-phosphate oxidase family protein [Couchioplanes caeruleus]OJF15199.1 pyridoxamine 5'-phosphate oxidase [Couchioplanes caeruleus subsp. caeruleus]ROP28020.1 PPOX class probable F420-dependent enzyme [Couchioplanes caeruleus]